LARSSTSAAVTVLVISATAGNAAAGSVSTACPRVAIASSIVVVHAVSRIATPITASQDALIREMTPSGFSSTKHERIPGERCVFPAVHPGYSWEKLENRW